MPLFTQVVKSQDCVVIVWHLTLFSTEFQLYRSGQCTYPCFPGVLLTSTPHNILSKPLAAFQHNHCRNNGGMNPVAMTIINPRKENWPNQGSNQRPLVLKSATLPTELWGLACGDDYVDLYLEQ